MSRRRGAPTPSHTVVSYFVLMKDYSYYQTTSVSIPRKDEYTTTYYYKKGVMVGMKKQFDEDFTPPKNCVEEKVLDQISYNAHAKHYGDEILRLQNEFRNDLIAKYNMTNHPKANKLFDKAWDIGCSLGYSAVEDYFIDLLELFQDQDTSDSNLIVG
jgi:hypothetical protein